MLDATNSPAGTPRGGRGRPEVLLEQLAEKLGNRNTDEVLLEVLTNLDGVLEKVQRTEPEWVTDQFGSPAKLRAELVSLRERNLAKAEIAEDKREVKETVKRQGWGKWFKDKLVKAGMIATYPVRHPIKTLKYAAITAAIVIPVGLAAAAVGFFLAGKWELFMTSVGLDKIMAAVRGTKSLTPPTVVTDPEPRGGVDEVKPFVPPKSKYKPVQ